MIREATLVTGIVSFMLIIMVPEAENAEQEPAVKAAPTAPVVPVKDTFDEDKYWENSDEVEDLDQFVFGEPIKRDVSKVLHDDDRKTVNPAWKKKRSGGPKGQSQEPKMIDYPKPMV